MKERQLVLMKDFLQHCNNAYHQMFIQLAEYAISLGYTPKKCKTSSYSLDFKSNKNQKAIMKMEELEQRHDKYGYGERGVPGLRLKFYASKEYSEMFRRGIKNVIEEFEGKYTGCYGCGRCNDSLQGYNYTYPDGKEVFRCGTELISIFDFTDKDLIEIKRLLKEQAEYFATVK
jgi:hypothetical protein